jgi:hypothetical protein
MKTVANVEFEVGASDLHSGYVNRFTFFLGVFRACIAGSTGTRHQHDQRGKNCRADLRQPENHTVISVSINYAGKHQKSAQR